MNNFESLAVKEFPHIKDTKRISRKEINSIVEKYGISYPHNIAHKSNNVSRGVFNFYFEKTDSVPVVEESYTEMDQRIRDSYFTMDTLISAVARGISPSLIISGGPGLGKSYSTKTILEQLGVKFTFAKGFAKSTGLFRLLYEHRNKGEVIVFDDCDSILTEDPVALNIFKSALELSETRVVSWLSEKEFIDDNGDVIPRFFQFDGSVIFLTNLNFDDLISKGSKLAPHYQALESRSLYFNVGVNNRKEIVCRLKQVVSESDISKRLGLTKKLETEILSYIEKNQDRLKDCSIRLFEKIAAITKMDPLFWEKLCDNLLIRK